MHCRHRNHYETPFSAPEGRGRLPCQRLIGFQDLVLVLEARNWASSTKRCQVFQGEGLGVIDNYHGEQRSEYVESEMSVLRAIVMIQAARKKFKNID